MKKLGSNDMQSGCDRVDADVELPPSERVMLAFDLYLSELADSLGEMQFTEEQIDDLIFRTADKLCDRKLLPPFPESDDERAMGEWLVAADRVGFPSLVVKLAEALHG